MGVVHGCDGVKEAFSVWVVVFPKALVLSEGKFEVPSIAVGPSRRVISRVVVKAHLGGKDFLAFAGLCCGSVVLFSSGAALFL